MARRAGIKLTCCNSIKFELSGRRVVLTSDFVRELHRYNHYCLEGESNAWIERYQTFFKGITPHEGDDRIYFLVNMGYVL